MADSRQFEKALNRYNSATFHRIPMKFDTMVHLTLLKGQSGAD